MRGVGEGGGCASRGADFLRLRSHSLAGPREAQSPPHGAALGGTPRACRLGGGRGPSGGRKATEGGPGVRERGACQALVATPLPPAWGISREESTWYEGLTWDDVTIPFLWGLLAPKVRYLPVGDRRRLQVALAVAFAAHAGQLRKSGEPFVTHPVEVTRILASLQLDAATLTAGLLHDTVEDTDALTFEDIEARFGAGVRRIVEGETRISKASGGRGGEVQDPDEAVDFRHFFTSMTEDVRIILVKLADRLHNMRTMGSMDTEKQKKKARETLYVFSPLADSLGLVAMKEELEELSITILDPERSQELASRMEATVNEQRSAVQMAQNVLLDHLNVDDFLNNQVSAVNVVLSWKPMYGLYKRLRACRWDWENNQHLKQIAQFQLILHVREECSVGPVGLCYYVLGLVHKLWTPIPQTMKDYIASPKAGWRKGLHTTLWPVGSRLVTPIEVHIQTADMYQADFNNMSSQLNKWLNGKGDRIEALSGLGNLGGSIDELDGFNGLSMEAPLNGNGNGAGITSEVQEVLRHSSVVVKEDSFKKYKTWLQSLKAWQDEVGGEMSAQDFVECVTEDFLVQSVYVLTPAGEVVQLPKGATVLDFAYHIHTDVGNRAMAAKVDGGFVSPDHQLKNAQVVEIFTLDSWQPDAALLSVLRSRIPMLQTKSAKKKLKLFLKKYEGEQDDADDEDCTPEDAAKRSTLWLVLECQDKPGILAEVSAVIAKHGLNVTKFWGYPSRKDEDVYVMRYNLGVPDQDVHELYAAFEDERSVTDWAAGCTLPAPDKKKSSW